MAGGTFIILLPLFFHFKRIRYCAGEYVAAGVHRYRLVLHTRQKATERVARAGEQDLGWRVLLVASAVMSTPKQYKGLGIEF